MQEAGKNRPPKEITQAPSGYEWTREYRKPVTGEHSAVWASSLGWVLYEGASLEEHPILRKVKPPTVMVELPRESVDYYANGDDGTVSHVDAVIRACRAALEAEEADAE